MSFIIVDPSNNIIILNKIKKKLNELNSLKSNLTKIITYILLLFILLIVLIIIYIATYNRKWLSRVKIKPIAKLPGATQS